ncbi:hypothetical protein, partial [Klebsiella pneumoniae]|uniref:hypothetical protein n=1 Tax=Klebsiella pneumoniae TaxID=573 RepID=UPI001D0E497D
QKACVLPENPASYRVVRTKSYLFNKAFLAMNVKYCLTINPVMWFRFMGEDFNILPAWHVDQSVKYSAR